MDRLVEIVPGTNAVIKTLVFVVTALPTCKFTAVLNDDGKINPGTAAPRIDELDEFKLTVRMPIGDLFTEPKARMLVTP